MKGWRATIAHVCGWLAALCVAGMMLVTVADVALRWFANYPLRGTVEIVELLLTCSFFLALAVVVLSILAWQGWISAQDTLVFGDVTSDLSIPKIYYWIPLLVGFIGAALTAFVILLSWDADKP